MTPELEQQQQQQKLALIGLLGQTYVQMREIDQHIAAAGSGAKFAGRSEDLKRQLQTVATAPVAAPPVIEMGPQMAPSPIFEMPAAAPTPAYQPPAPVVPPANSTVEEQQLEFNFTKADKNILTDIYNVLYDIKKILLESKDKDKKPKKKKLVECIVCGSDAVCQQINDNYKISCRECNASTQEHANIKVCVKEWNDTNK